jgi:hypothetical protein
VISKGTSDLQQDSNTQHNRQPCHEPCQGVTMWYVYAWLHMHIAGGSFRGSRCSTAERHSRASRALRWTTGYTEGFLD